MAPIQYLTIAAWISLVLGGLIISTVAFRKENPTANVILIVWTILRVYRQFLLVWIQDHPTSTVVLIYRTHFLAQMLGIPIIYLFVRAFTEEGFTWRKISPLHLFPFFACLAWLGWIHASNVGHAEVYTYDETYWWNGIYCLLGLIYTYLMIKKIREFRIGLLNTRSNIGIYRLPFLHLIVMCCLLAILTAFLDILTGPKTNFWSVSLGMATFSLLLVTALIMRQTDVFRVELQSEPTVVLEEGELGRLKKSLAKILDEQKLYLNPQLRLKDLAEAMGVKSYRLTAVLRQGLHTTFYDLINQMRIDHAKRLLASKDQTMNILGIASESGFNSKSAFNELFKKYNHSTPSEFRRKVLQT